MRECLIALFTCLLFLLAVPGNHEALATCAPPVTIVGDSFPAISIQDAYDYASQSMTDFTLLLSGEIFSEDLFIDQGSVTLDGGYDCLFSSKTTIPTGIFGKLTIDGTGSVNVMGDIRILSTDQCAFDGDSDGYFVGYCAPLPLDCNDNDPTIHPGAEELCDGDDNNCDGQIDEGVLIDADSDGYYDASSCPASPYANDCDDTDATINPGELDLPDDGIDQDCNGLDLVYTEGIYEPGFQGECYFCHGPGSGYNDLHLPTMATDATCADCHSLFVINILSAHYGRTVATAGNGMTAGATIDCKSCHDQIDILHNFGSNTIWPVVKAAQPNVTCDTCHEDRAADHDPASAHDNRIILSACGDCHTGSSGALANDADVDDLHLADCGVCHNYTGTTLNTAIVREVISKGAGGAPVSCTDCHMDKASGHIDFVHPISVGPNDLSYDPPGVLCDGCHVVSSWAEIEGFEHDVATNGVGSCATCHKSTRQDVIDTIAQAGNPIRCLDCHADKEMTPHGAHDHSTTITGSADCIACHVHNDPQIVEIIHGNNCAACHNSPRIEVRAVIGSGQAECIDCHTAHDSQNIHDKLQAPDDCRVCHTDKITGTDFGYIMENHAHPVLGFSELEKCQRCHNSPSPDHVTTISNGIAGSTVYCTGCHVDQHIPITSPGEIHFSYILTGTSSTCTLCHDTNDRTHSDMFATAACATCHDSANQDEYNLIHQNDCLLCHLSQRSGVISAIYAGVTGTPAECISCHTASWEATHATTPIDHTGIVTVSGTSCASCHDNTLVDASSLTHSACNTCHDATTGVLINLAEGQTAPGDCTSCHGSVMETAHTNCFVCHETPPAGATSPNTEGSHAEHEILGFGATYPSCVACHEGLTHNNGTADVTISSSFDALSGVASSNGSTCSSTSCHGGQMTPPWTTGIIDVETQCTACHAEGTAEYNSYNSGKHWKHTEVSCTGCHSLSTLATGHFSNLETATFEQLPATTIGGSDTEVGSYDGARCSNISCHRDKGW